MIASDKDLEMLKILISWFELKISCSISTILTINALRKRVTVYIYQALQEDLETERSLPIRLSGILDKRLESKYKE